MTKLYLILITCIVFYAYQDASSITSEASLTIPESKSVSDIKVDPRDAISKKRTTDLLNSVFYLPLETTDESMFAQITQLEITSKYFIIWDESTNSILFFLKDGRFKKKISNNDKSIDSSFKKINRFAINKAKNEIIISDDLSPKQFIYSIELAKTKWIPIY